MSGLDYLNNLWELDVVQNSGSGVTEEDKKKQFAFKIWKEDFVNLQKREDSKKSDLKDTWTDVFQLIGFFNVFQGVWFQGVTQLAPQVASCRASILPIVLSVLVSIATIIGVHVKLARIFTLKKAFAKDRLDSKIQESRITAFGREGLNFDLSTLDVNANQSQKSAFRSIFEKELEELHRTRVVLLALLAILSGLFAWLIGAIMCHKFP